MQKALEPLFNEKNGQNISLPHWLNETYNKNTKKRSKDFVSITDPGIPFPLRGHSFHSKGKPLDFKAAYKRNCNSKCYKQFRPRFPLCSLLLPTNSLPHIQHCSHGSNRAMREPIRERVTHLDDEGTYPISPMTKAISIKRITLFSCHHISYLERARYCYNKGRHKETDKRVNYMFPPNYEVCDYSSIPIHKLHCLLHSDRAHLYHHGDHGFNAAPDIFIDLDIAWQYL